jgi:hypothetical protein
MRAIEFSWIANRTSLSSSSQIGRFYAGGRASMVQENRLDADNLITDSFMGTMRTMICVVALFSAGKLAAFAQGASDADAASKILALESAWNQAVETRDTKALNAIFDNFLEPIS